MADSQQIRSFERLLARRLLGEPIAYLLHEKEFWGRLFWVDRRVLIPRSETEHVVETVLQLNLPDAPRVLELGTGSGCVAITLALEIPNATVVASDLSASALAVARRNFERHQCEPRLVLGDLLTSFRLERFDLVVCNPPYIADSERAGLAVEIRDFEPPIALFSGSDGLEVIEAILHQASRIAAGVPIVLEIGATQAESIARLASRYDLEVRRTVQDLAGLDRVLVLESRPTDRPR